MSISYKWVNFLVCPCNPNFITTYQDRLSKELLNDEVHRGNLKLVTMSTIIPDNDNDKFEAIEINEHGDVIIWTRKRVWGLRRAHGMEKLIFWPRNPPSTK